MEVPRYTVLGQERIEGKWMRERYQPVREESGEYVVINIKGVQAFVYAKKDCKNCYGRGWIGTSDGCTECLGEGKKYGVDCIKCKGAGKGKEGEKYHFPCPCLKHEFEGEKEEEYLD